MKKLAGDLIESLKAQPIILAFIMINLIFMVVIALVLREVGQAIERRDAIIERCLNR